ncbi:glycoside hydrolase family 12 protein [Ramaria rubella]|nr:glycoside hydrolase family 12 protein [Ramaria rubella]
MLESSVAGNLNGIKQNHDLHQCPLAICRLSLVNLCCNGLQILLPSFEFLPSFAISSVVSSPTALDKRGAVLSAQFATESEAGGGFFLEKWDFYFSLLPSCSDTSQEDSTSGDTVSWHTTCTWVGGNLNVKAYANLDLRIGLGQSLESITSIPVTWDWTYSSASSNLVADVSFDLWLSESDDSSGANSTSTFEMYVVVVRGSAGPAGSQIGTADVNGVTWNLFRGTVSTWTVMSFVALSEITSFSSDVKPFLTYLMENQGVPPSQFLVQAQGGTEPFIGTDLIIPI